MPDYSAHLSTYSTYVLDKARDLVERGGVHLDDQHDDVWWVEGSNGARYRVQVIPSDLGLWITCSCPNGRAQGARPSCYHTAAVTAYLEQEEED